eukprot:m.59593 g.59593  ORF g.59593 m.59593 type:complete len:473 (-) comp7913_c0_seq1:354-1772(-)
MMFLTQFGLPQLQKIALLCVLVISYDATCSVVAAEETFALLAVNADGNLVINNTGSSVVFNGRDVLATLSVQESRIKQNKEKIATQGAMISSLTSTIACPTFNYDLMLEQYRLNLTETGVGWAATSVTRNGLLVGIPFSSSVMLIYNISSGELDTSSVVVNGLNSKWVGGVTVPIGDGEKIFGIPFNYNHVLVFDPQTNAVDFTTLIVGQATSEMYTGGVLGDDGNIYCCPYKASNVLVIDPLENSTDYSSLQVPTMDVEKWSGCVKEIDDTTSSLSPTQTFTTKRRLFCIPFLAPTVLIITTSTEKRATLSATLETASLDFTSMTVGSNSVGMWVGGVASPRTGKIYGIPSYATSLLIIDPSTNMIDYTSVTVPSGMMKWSHGVYDKITNRIIGFPYLHDHLLVINLDNEDGSDGMVSADATTLLTKDSASKWVSGTVGPDNKIYALPHLEDSILVLTPTFATRYRSDKCV